MQQRTFVNVALVAFALVVFSFFVLGFSRLVLPYRTARLLAAPFGLIAFALVVVLFVQSVLSVSGLRPLDDEE